VVSAVVNAGRTAVTTFRLTAAAWAASAAGVFSAAIFRWVATTAADAGFTALPALVSEAPAADMPALAVVRAVATSRAWVVRRVSVF
jgi:hypothetical protein